MKITQFEIRKVPPSWVWLLIHTDAGISGIGEPYLENHPESVIAETRLSISSGVFSSYDGREFIVFVRKV